MEISTEQFFGFAFLAYFFWTLTKGSKDETNSKINEPPYPWPEPPPPPPPTHGQIAMLIEKAQRKTAAQIDDSEKWIIFALNNSVNSPMPKKTIEKSVRTKKWDYPRNNKNGLTGLKPDFDLPIDTKILVWDNANRIGPVKHRRSKSFNGNLDLLVFREGETSHTASEFPEVAKFWEIAEGKNKGDRNF